LCVEKNFSTSSRASAEQKLPGGTDQEGAHSVVKLGLHLLPVVLNVLPGLVAVFRLCSGSDGKLDDRVLVAHLAADGVVERALDQSGVFKRPAGAARPPGYSGLVEVS
jgi:hypothetical protein